MYKYIYIQYIYTSTTVSLYPVSLIISVPEYQVPSKSILSYIEYYLNTPLGILMYYKRDWKLHCPKCIGLKVS